MKSLFSAVSFAVALALLIGTSTGLVQRFVPRAVLFRLLHGEWQNPYLMTLAILSPTALPTAKPIVAVAVPPTSRGAAQFPTYPATFRPYAANSVFNMPVCNAANNNCTGGSHPTYLSNSNAIIAKQFPDGQNPDPLWQFEAGKYDYHHPIYYASLSDPLVNVACNQFCNGAYTGKIRIPAKARPAGGSDAHMTVIQPDGTEIDFWATWMTPGSDPNWKAPHDMQIRDWRNGDTVTGGGANSCGNYFTGTGTTAPGVKGATASNFCLRAGIVTAAELIAGTISHALFVNGGCTKGFQYPASDNDIVCAGIGPPMGAREWYDVPCATTQANNALRPWEKAILCALNRYGGYVGDANLGGNVNYTGGIVPQLESEEPWRAFYGRGTYNNSYTSPFAPLASQGWSSTSISSAIGTSSGNRWVGAYPWHPSGIDFPAHVHWLAPCSARGTC